MKKPNENIQSDGLSKARTELEALLRDVMKEPITDSMAGLMNEMRALQNGIEHVAKRSDLDRVQKEFEKAVKGIRRVLDGNEDEPGLANELSEARASIQNLAGRFDRATVDMAHLVKAAEDLPANLEANTERRWKELASSLALSLGTLSSHIESIERTLGSTDAETVSLGEQIILINNSVESVTNIVDKTLQWVIGVTVINFLFLIVVAVVVFRAA